MPPTHTTQTELYHFLTPTAKSINVEKTSRHPEYHYNMPSGKFNAAVTTLKPDYSGIPRDLNNSFTSDFCLLLVFFSLATVHIPCTHLQTKPHHTLKSADMLLLHILEVLYSNLCMEGTCPAILSQVSCGFLIFPSKYWDSTSN
jgi:hypothetical protein